MKTTEYTGPSAAIKGDCPWLASEDILGKGDIVVTIEACHAVQDAEFEGGRKEDLYTLSFVGAKKQLILNSTNRKTLVSLYGTNVGFKENYPNINVVGLMGMASFVNDQDQLTREFSELQKIYDQYKEQNNFTTLSMGMSGDYKLAIAHGSTMVRIGSAIFGERNYN